MLECPLVSINIPTFNSEKTLPLCLASISKQTFPNLEVIVVDSFSNDSTTEIAKAFGAKVLRYRGKLLGARYLGFQMSQGQLILLLDSDQILESTAIERAVKLISEGFDMLCLEESCYELRNWIQKLFEADRRLIHKFSSHNLDPLYGMLLPRFFKREILERAFEAIPKQLMPIVTNHDHAIINFEARKVSSNVGILSSALKHIEPDSLIGLWKKQYRYGKNTRMLLNTGLYRDIVMSRSLGRKGMFSRNRLAPRVLLMLALKFPLYFLGYMLG